MSKAPGLSRTATGHPVWTALSHYTIGPEDAELSFAARLARENGWTGAEAERVIEEYKRFCFLAVTAEHPVTPSDQVDQAWHLHLTYSRDYWERFCPEVLGRALHHGPTAGGRAEGHRYFTQYAETVAARLLSTRQLAMAGKNKFTPSQFGGGTPVERSVLALPDGASWDRVAGAVGKHGEGIRERLVDAGLLMDGWNALQMRFFQTLPYFLLLGFGYTKLLVGEARGKPVGYLTALLVVTGILALIRFAALDRRTRAGQEALAEARMRSERLRRAPAGGETDLAVALFGTVVLVGSDWGGFHQMRAASSGGDSGSGGSGSGSGGSGCGGGGCGGCGS